MDAHGYGKRFIVRSEEKLTAFLEPERAIHAFAVTSISKRFVREAQPEITQSEENLDC